MFVFSCLLPDAGGQIILVYSVHDEPHLPDPSVPEAMQREELRQLLGSCRTRQNHPLRLLTMDWVGASSYVYNQRLRSKRRNPLILPATPIVS